MSEHAWELVGGPMDGELVALQHGMFTYYLRRVGPLRCFASVDDDVSIAPPDTGCYAAFTEADTTARILRWHGWRSEGDQ